MLSLFTSKKVLIVKCVCAEGGREGLQEPCGGMRHLKRRREREEISFVPQEHRRQIEEVFC